MKSFVLLLRLTRFEYTQWKCENCFCNVLARSSHENPCRILKFSYLNGTNYPSMQEHRVFVMHWISGFRISQLELDLRLLLSRGAFKSFSSFSLPVMPISYSRMGRLSWGDKKTKKFSFGLLNVLPAWPWDFQCWQERRGGLNRAGSWKEAE